MTQGSAAPSITRGWEHLPHEADIGVRGFGPTIDAAFEEAAMALTAVITEPAKVEARERIAISCTAPDDGLLFVEWLNALVYEMATRRMLFGRFRVAIKDGSLAGEAWGEAIDVARHQPATEVKGATLTALQVEREPSGRWIAQCVVDV